MLCVRIQARRRGDMHAQLDVPTDGKSGEVRGTGHRWWGALLRNPADDVRCHFVASASLGRAGVASW